MMTHCVRVVSKRRYLHHSINKSLIEPCNSEVQQPHTVLHNSVCRKRGNTSVKIFRDGITDPPPPQKCNKVTQQNVCKKNNYMILTASAIKGPLHRLNEVPIN